MISCMFAVILIMKPNFIMKYLPNSLYIESSVSIIWYLLALLTAIVRAFNTVIVRTLKGKANEYILSHYFCIFGIVLTVPFLTYNKIVRPVF